MPLAVLSIDLEARLAKFEQDMGKATRLLEKLGDSAGSSVGRIGEVFAGSFIASAAEEGLKRLIDLFPQLIEGVAKFQDLADETGASAEGLARMQTAADVSGVSIDNLAGLMVKLTGNLSKLTDDGKGASQALANLGIPLQEFRDLAPDEQIAKLSAAFNSFADGSAKTSNALALFGKSGAQVLKFFKEFGDGTEAVTRLTNDQIKAADAFGDASAKASSELKQTAQVIAIQALPALTALKQGAKDAAAAIFGIQGAGAAIKADTAILDFVEAVAIGFGTVGEAIIGVVKLVDAIAGSFRAVAADIALPFQVAGQAYSVLAGKSIGEAVVGIKAALDQRNKTVADANQKYVDLWNFNGTAVTAAIRKSFAAQRSLLTAPEGLKDTRGIPGDNLPTLKPVTKVTEDDKKAQEALARFLADIEKRKNAAQAELDVGGKLAESDKFRMDILAKLSEEEGKLSAGAQARVRAALDEAVAVLKLNEARESELKAKQGAARIDAQYQAAADGRINALIGENAALELNIEELGKTADAIDRLRVKRLEEQRDAARGDPGGNDREVNLIQRKIDLTQKLIDKRNFAATDGLTGANDALAEFIDNAAKAGNATRDATKQSLSLLEDDLTTGLATGKISVKRTVDFIISEFLRLSVVRPLLKSILGDGSGAGGFFANLFGGGRGGGSGNLTEFFGGGGPFALGAAFGATGVIPHATGSIVNSPRFFAAGGTLNVMGEAGPEGILPLKRGRDGKLGVTMAGGGQPVVVHNVTNLTLSGDPNPATLAAMQSLVARNNQQLVRSLKQGTLGG